jgi:hypothetical protein
VQAPHLLGRGVLKDAIDHARPVEACEDSVFRGFDD